MQIGSYLRKEVEATVLWRVACSGSSVPSLRTLLKYVNAAVSLTAVVKF